MELINHGLTPGVNPGILAARTLKGMRTMDGSARYFGRDAAVSGGLAFLTSELAKRDAKLREPLTSITYPRDMPIQPGGGWIDYTEVEFVDYGVSGPNQYGLTSNAANQVPVVSVNIEKDIYRVFNWENVMKVNYIDLQKSQTIGRSLDNMLERGIKLNWEKTMDSVIYTGWGGYPGLTNNPNVAQASVPVGAKGFTQWNQKTPMEIVNDINQAILATVAASQYDLSGLANHICIPWAQFSYIANQIVSDAGNVSILTYVMQNNIAKTQGVTIQIHPLRWLAGAGANGTDRMVSYVNNEDKIYIDVPVPLSRIMTMPSVDAGIAYLTAFAGQIGVVKFLYTQPVQYSDGI